MLYFVPAWYKQNSWWENEQFWHRRRMYSEFDETIKQIQLFHRNVDIPYRILLLSYAPNFRHFLHRQGMYRAAYWSCFDAIQQVKRKKVAILSFHELKWPDGVEFIYSQFAIIVFLNGERYAQIQFGENGNMISVEMFEKKVVSRVNYYDDRGFVSVTEIYEEGKFVHRDYLTENGKWKLREYADGHVDVNPQIPEYDIEYEDEIQQISFRQNSYQSIADVIQEVFASYVMHTTQYDKFFVPIHPLHIEVVERVLQNKYIIGTFFEDRFEFDKILTIKDFLNKAEFLITDSKKTSQDIQNRLRESGMNIGTYNVRDIPPYDTRMDFGISTQLKVQKILVPVDGVSDEKLSDVIVMCAKYLLQNDKAMVHLFTRNGEWGLEEKLLKKTATILKENGYDERWAIENDFHKVSENKIDEDEEESVEVRYFVEQCIDERTISKCINEQRVILDVRGIMDVFMFATAVSKGVPRISVSKDQFFEHGKNGHLLKDFSEIPAVLSYYLDNFENWNAALVESYEIGQKYTTQVLLKAWEEVLISVERS